jgi:cytochrome c-type biogenesis protein CcmH/NrfG
MAAAQDFRDQLGKAWTSHRGGQQEAAIREFEAILNVDSEQIDALYGLGLAQRANGDREAAATTWQKSLALVKAKLTELPGDDHFEMLERMTNQRLHELSPRP